MKWFTLIAVLSVITTKLVVGKCPPAAIEGLIPDVCYVFNENPLTWADAEEECSQLGGHLASITSGFLNAFLAKNGRSSLPTYWTGGRLNGTTAPPTWTWTDGSKWAYTSWAKGQPANADSNCLLLNTALGSTRNWLSASSAQTNGRICSVPAVKTSPKCPADWFGIPSSPLCYKLVTDQQQLWNVSLDACRSEPQGDLASITSERMNQEIASEVRNTYGIIQFWIGGWSTGPWDGASHFAWSDGSPFVYTSWEEDEPSDLVDTAVSMDQVGEWSTDDWYREMPFLCEMRP